jgi:hypothetical protein
MRAHELLGEMVERGPVGELVVVRGVGRAAVSARDALRHEAKDEPHLGVEQRAGDGERAAGAPVGRRVERLEHLLDLGPRALALFERAGGVLCARLAHAHREERGGHRLELFSMTPHEVDHLGLVFPHMDGRRQDGPLVGSERERLLDSAHVDRLAVEPEGRERLRQVLGDLAGLPLARRVHEDDRAHATIVAGTLNAGTPLSADSARRAPPCGARGSWRTSAA